MKLFATYQNLNSVQIYRNNLLHNIDSIKSRHPAKGIIAVIKSNAYGHGLREIASILADADNIPIIAVDSLYEAYILHRLGIKKKVLILGYTNPRNYTIKKLPFSFAVSDSETLHVLDTYQKGARIHIEIDTGMGRLGIRYESIPAFIRELRKCPHIIVEGIMSHFADADSPDTAYTYDQLELFQKAISYFEMEGYHVQYKHINASGGIMALKEDITTMVRPGLLLFGIGPLGSHGDFMPALSLTSTIVQTKEIHKGEYIGYSRTFKAPKDMRIGILGLGYYEGLDRRLSNRGSVIVTGVACPIVGRVSMNMAAVDITAVKEAHVLTPVTVYSQQSGDINSIQQSAILSNTIPYDLLVHINESIKREIIA